MHAPHSGVSGSKRRGLRDISNTPLQVDVSTPFKSIDPKFGTPVSKKRRVGTPSEKFAQKNSNCKYHVDSGKSKQRVVKFGTPGPSYRIGTPGPSYAGASTKKTPTFGASSGAGTLVVQGVSAGSKNAAQESGQVPHEFRFAGDQSNPIGAARPPSLHHSAFSRPAFPGLRPNAAPTFGVAGGQHQVPMQTPGRYASGSGPDVHMTTSQAAAGGEEHVDVVDELEQIVESPIFNVDDEFSLGRSPFIEPAAEASKPLHAKGDASTSAAAGAQHEDRSANITAAPYPPIQGFCDDRTEEAKRAAAIGQPLLPDMDLSMGERRQISQVLNKLFPRSGSEFTSTTNAAHKNCSAKSSPSSSSPFQRAPGGAPSSRQSRNNAFLLEEGEDIAFEDLPSPRFEEDGSLRDVTSGQPAAAPPPAGQRPGASFADLEFRAAPTLF
eukprot:g7113.t1